jgi:cellobiose phosphorylase
MYRLIVESLLGLKRKGDQLGFGPCLPAAWESIQIDYRYRETIYHITMVQAHGVGSAITVSVDGVTQLDRAVSLTDDGLEHLVSVTIPAASQTRDDVPALLARP